MNWPGEENLPEIDWMSTPFPEIACRMQERAQEAEKVAARWDEGLLALEVRLASMHPGSSLSPQEVMFFVGAVATYGAVGLRAPWIAKALAEVGR